MLPIVAGIGAGVVTSLALSQRSSGSAPTVITMTPHLEPARARTPAAGGTAPQNDGVRAELDALRTRVHQMERAHPAGDAPEVPGEVDLDRVRAQHEQDERTSL